MYFDVYQIDSSSTMDGALKHSIPRSDLFSGFLSPDPLHSDYCAGKKNSGQEKSLHGVWFNLWLPSTNLILLGKLEKKR